MADYFEVDSVWVRLAEPEGFVGVTISGGVSSMDSVDLEMLDGVDACIEADLGLDSKKY